MQKVSYGEVIERDRTVSIGCFFDGNGLTSCGWWFKPTVCKDLLRIDIVYFPSDQFISSLQTPPVQVSVLDHCHSIVFGSHPLLPETEKRDAIVDMKELNQTIRTI